MITTKEQERKALEQIKKIIAGLGENSYIATAMDGMIEDAEENIENDFAMSWKNRAESAAKELSLLQKKYDEDTARLKAGRDHLEEKYEAANKKAETYLQEGMEAYQTIRLLKEGAEEHQEAARKMQECIDRQNAEKEQMALEIMKLKARLFDLMEK